MVLGGEEGSVCEVLLDGIQLKHVLEFKFLVCVLDESGTDGAKALGAIRFLMSTLEN